MSQGEYSSGISICISILVFLIVSWVCATFIIESKLDSVCERFGFEKCTDVSFKPFFCNSGLLSEYSAIECDKKVIIEHYQISSKDKFGNSIITCDWRIKK